MNPLISRTVYIRVFNSCMFITKVSYHSRSVILCFVGYNDKLTRFLSRLDWTAWVSKPHSVYIYCKIWMELFRLFALLLALWCLYIYTVWLVYCAIVLHVRNKLEWAWPSGTWADHLYFISFGAAKNFIKKSQHRRYTIQVKYEIYKELKLQQDRSSNIQISRWKLIIPKINKLSES